MCKAIQKGKLVIVCEGEKTEPWFVWDLYQYLTDKGTCRVEMPAIEPAPVDEAKVEKLDGTTRQSHHRPLKGVTPMVEEIAPIDNGQPLNWVNKAHELLSSYDEAWVMYDNDNHPRLREALDKILLLRQQGKHINLAYSSLSFEYYMLLHHQYLCHKFEKTECYDIVKGKHKYRKCCSTKPKPMACDGELSHDCCINGYARKNNLWNESKQKGVLSNMPNLWKGITNGCRLKWESIANQGTQDIHSRNPYLNTYSIILRFLGIRSLEQDRSVLVPYKKSHITFTLTDDVVHAHNYSNVDCILSTNDMPIYDIDIENNDENKLSQMLYAKNPSLSRKVIPAASTAEIPLDAMDSPSLYSIFNISGEQIYVYHTHLHAPLTDKDKYRLNWSDF